MVQVLKRCLRTAAKAHKCNYCGLEIGKGQTYCVDTCKFDGRIYDWKSHHHCSEIVSKLNMIDETDGGITGEYFCEFIDEEFQNIMSEKYTGLWEDDNFEYPDFTEILEFVLNENNIAFNVKTGIELIAEERKRQIEVKGYTAESDDTLTRGQLAIAAFCYCLPPKYRPAIGPSKWLSTIGWEWKPGKRKKDLIKAGAFIAAELDRLQRLENE